MSDYLHGAYGDTQSSGNRVSASSGSAVVCIGTAPVHTVAGGAENVNKPVLVNNIAEARRYFGYSEDWAKYTMCEVMHHFFETKGIGPLVMINVFDPEAHREEQETTITLTPISNRITIADAESIMLDSVVVKSGDGESAVVKEKGVDYTIAYSAEKQSITITGTSDGSLGSGDVTVTCASVKPEDVTFEEVIGSSDGLGTNTGIFAVRNVYQMTGVIPAYMIAPGFSGVPSVHAAMYQNARKVNGHWDMWMFTDLPIENDGTGLTMDSVVTFKRANGYNHENETVYFPMAQGTDGRKYHLSVLAAANFLELLGENEGIPYHSASNTDAPIIAKLWLGADGEGKLFDDQIINEKLNKNGIASAAYVGGRWAIWGAHAADYSQDSADYVNVAETNRMMLYYVSNDFQSRRPRDTDKPMTANDIASIVAEEQNRLDALKAMGALIYGEALMQADGVENSDVYMGDFAFEFRVTTTPLAKSLSAVVTWVEDGFSTYFATGDSDAV